jgi:hypothetical protein
MSCIFTDDDITFSECSESSKGDIFEISDRSWDEGEHNGKNTEYRIQNTEYKVQNEEKIIQLSE